MEGFVGPFGGQRALVCERVKLHAGVPNLRCWLQLQRCRKYVQLYEREVDAGNKTSGYYHLPNFVPYWEGGGLDFHAPARSFISLEQLCALVWLMPCVDIYYPGPAVHLNYTRLAWQSFGVGGIRYRVLHKNLVGSTTET